jgi:hypothetical protein
MMLALLFAGCANAQERASDKSPVLPTNSRSLQPYLIAAFRAFQSGDMDAFNRLLDGLKLPDPDRSFREWFGLDEVPTMNAHYDQNFEAFRSRLSKFFAWAGSSNATMTLQSPPKTTDTVASTSKKMLKGDFRIERFKFVLAAKDKGRNEWMDSFVLDDGSLRFIGQGGFPFWFDMRTIKERKAPFAN